MAVTSRAPRWNRKSIAAPSEPPVASIGSRTKHCRSLRSTGSRSAYVVGSRVSSLRTIPRKPTSAVGRSLTMPSSMPRPARRIGTTIGRGSLMRTPTVVVTGVVISCGETRTLRVASYASSVTRLLGELTEHRRRSGLVAQHRELVGDEGVIGDVHAWAQG